MSARLYRRMSLHSVCTHCLPHLMAYVTTLAQPLRHSSTHRPVREREGDRVISDTETMRRELSVRFKPTKGRTGVRKSRKIEIWEQREGQTRMTEIAEEDRKNWSGQMGGEMKEKTRLKRLTWPL